MSQNNQSQPQRNEAVRTFASEFNEATIQFKDPDEIEERGEERAANYSLLPTGARANRVLMMGTIMEVTEVSSGFYRARLVDTTGEFYIYAGERYNKEEYNTLDQLAPPGDRTKLEVENNELEHIMVVGKPNTYTTDEGETYVSVDPENIIISDAVTRERCEAETISRTLERLESYNESTAPYSQEASQHYDYNHSDLLDDLLTAISELEEVAHSQTDDVSPDANDPAEAEPTAA